jgi:outer membrane protein assembly factor BamE (lipoprotein component of BamABCDE complex)
MRSLVVAVSLVCLAGCGSTVGHQISADSLRTIRPGVSNKSSVLAALGQPNARQNMYGQESWTYNYIDTSVSLGATAFVPLIGGFLPGAVNSSSQMQIVIVSFDKGIVKSCTVDSRETGGTSGGGFVPAADLGTQLPNSVSSQSNCAPE